MADKNECGEIDLMQDSEGEDDWQEVDEDDETPTKCLFCDTVCDNSHSTLKHCVDAHDFNLCTVKNSYCLDFYGCIKLINYIRKKKVQSNELENLSQPFPWESQEFLQSTLPEDPLLWFDFDEELGKYKDLTSKLQNGDTENCNEDSVSRQEYKELKKKLLLTEERAFKAETDLAKARDDINQLRMLAKTLLEESTSNTSENRTDKSSESDDEDSAYFSSYAHFGIHEEMLKDKVRTDSYRDFILGNPQIFKDKVVLDIGCGTGILSMFAAQAGARHVVAVDQSEILYQAMDIIRENGLEKVITLVKGKVEEISIPFDQVDVIISEWMGYFLLFESMLDTVLFARDKWLSPSGKVFPEQCSIHLVAMGTLESQPSKLSYWDNVYGFKMSCMKTSVAKEPCVTIVDPKAIISPSSCIKRLDVNKCKKEELNFISSFKLKISRDDTLTAVVAYFDIAFDESATKKVEFSTSPGHQSTHWKQTVFYLGKPFQVTKGQLLKGHISCYKNVKDTRSLDIRIEMVTDDDNVLFDQEYLLQ